MENNRNPDSTSSFVERIAEKLGGSANAARIYGEPVERNGVTIIPVSKAMYGFGGGGGMVLSPIGYIEMKEGSTRFHTILDSQTLIKLFAISGAVVLLTARSITKVVCN